MAIVPPWFWITMTFLLGITVGSFLNVVIWRLPRGGSLTQPVFSYCPHCKARLTALDLIPLLSFLALRQRCRRCHRPISWRYFWVELLTGALFVAVYLRFPQNAPNCVALLLFTAVLIPIFYIDLERFEIPDRLNLIAFLIAVGRDVWGIARQEPGHELLWGWLPRSVLGAIVGILIFGTVRVIGWLWKRVEAMGLGDVLLARAMGAMLVSVTPAAYSPLRLFPIWVMLSCFAGVIVGPALILARRRQAAKAGTSADAPSVESEEAEFEDDSPTLKKELLDIGWCLWLGDAADYLRAKLAARRGEPMEEVTDDWKPLPTAIPFGPFLVVGFLATVFFGEWATAAYLAYALPKPG
jgi:leader peptidase (prepilin peptidase)/N-methyltransferase